MSDPSVSGSSQHEFVSEELEVVTESHTGVRCSSNGEYIVPTAPGLQEQITVSDEMQSVTPGSQISICGKVVTVLSTGMRIIDSQRGEPERYITKLGLDSFLSGRGMQLYVDREPYLLNQTEGKVWLLPTNDVERIREK